MKFTKSIKVYILLVLILSFSSAVTVFLPFGSMMGQYEMPTSKVVMAFVSFFMMLIIYGGLGLIGLNLSDKLGFPKIWDEKITNKERFLVPAFIGVAIGIVFIISDFVFRQFYSTDASLHPPFPTSIFASISAGIGEEIVFRLFYISFWVWLISSVFLKKKWKDQVFWIISFLSALIFAVGHVPSVMGLMEFDSVSDIPVALWLEIFLLNGLLSIFAAKYYRKYGFLAAVSIHFWVDIIWHVVYGLFQ